jgi:uncharacterized protein (DUF1501 family)
MSDFSRRQFLKFTGVGAVGTLAATLTFEEVARAATVAPLPVGTPILVVVTLYGGNDGLNTVVPYLDPVYTSSRPGLSLTSSQVLPLSDGLALNGSMTGFKALWDEQKLAIVLGTSYPQPNYSHFSSMAIWQTASPVEQISSGWIGRWLDAQPHDPFRAIGIGDVLIPLMAGNRRVGSVLPVSGLQVPSGSLAAQAQQLAQASSLDSTITAEAAQAIGDLFQMAATVGPALKSVPPSSATALGKQLDVVASLIGANVPTRVYSVTASGFDLHADELSKQNTLVGSVSDAVAGFLTQIGSTARASDVVVMVYSEFGRRVKANGSQGTDHGTSAPVFVAGARVVGGFYGEQPSLTNLVNGDLAVTTDFRDVYASMLEDVLDRKSVV